VAPDRARLIESWKQEEAWPFSGWDFSHLEGRMFEERPPWDYMGRAAVLMGRSSAVLDMGTGGGERLLELKPHWPARVAASEGYAPNVKLATERLGPLGVEVVDAWTGTSEPMPFGDGEFDLVINRHSGTNPSEVARILSADGTFLTQQVHGLHGQDLIAAFGAAPLWPHATCERKVARLEGVGLKVVTVQDWLGVFSFTDVGAVIYYLKAVPWMVEGFSVDTHLGALLALQRRFERGEPLAFEARKYLIEARKDSPG
jgi:hypothetical protein